MSPRCLSDFAGRWTLRREIEDRQLDRTGHATGEAVLHETQAGLVYDERVRLAFPDQPPLEGTRRYLWRADGDGVAVVFEDGRAFHRFSLNTAQAEAAHWCDPDQYDVSYSFADWPVWRSVWRVRGPRKDYRMCTQYTPAPSD